MHNSVTSMKLSCASSSLFQQASTFWKAADNSSLVDSVLWRSMKLLWLRVKWDSALLRTFFNFVASAIVTIVPCGHPCAVLWLYCLAQTSWHGSGSETETGWSYREELTRVVCTGGIDTCSMYMKVAITKVLHQRTNFWYDLQNKY